MSKRMEQNKQKEKMIWTDADTAFAIKYKKDVKNGKIQRIKYTGSLKEILTA